MAVMPVIKVKVALDESGLAELRMVVAEARRLRAALESIANEYLSPSAMQAIARTALEPEGEV